MINHEMRHAKHPIFWWNIKVVCGFILIAGVCLRYLVNFPEPLMYIPAVFGQALVVTGGIVFVYHYILLRQHNASIFEPTALISNKGLFRFIRHPMYAADVIMYLGFVLMMPHLVTIIIFVVALPALYHQAKVEDRYMASRFEQQHQHWRKTTWLIVPGL